MKTKVFSFLLLGAITALATSAVLAQDEPSDPRSAPWAPVAQPGAPPPLAQAVPGAPGTRVSPPIAIKKPDKLEDIIAEVVQKSPDVQVAEAQLREAEARLRQAQMQAVQKATEAYQQRIRAEEIANVSKEALKRIEEKKQAGVASPDEVVRAQQALAEAQAEIARYGAELQALLGAGWKSLRNSFASPELKKPDASVALPRPTLDTIENAELKAILNTPVSVELENANLSELTGYIAEGYALNIAVDAELAGLPNRISIRLEEVKMKDALLAIADCHANACFIIREYGLFVTTPQRAELIPGPCIPDNVPFYAPKPSAATIEQSPVSPTNETTLVR